MPQLQLHTLQSSLALFSFVFIHQPSCTNEALTKNVSGLSHMSWKKHNRHHSDNFKIYSWINCLNGWSCKKTFWFILPSMNVTLRRYPLPNHSKWEVIIYGVRMHIQLPTLINPNSTCTETGSTNSLILIPLSVWADWRFIGGNAHAHRWVHTYTQVQCDSHCSWAQTPNLPRNSPGSQPPQMLAPGLWISGATAPLSLLVFRPAHTHIGIYRADIFSPGDPSSAHTHTHTHSHTCMGSWCFTAAQQALALVPPGVSLTGLSLVTVPRHTVQPSCWHNDPPLAMAGSPHPRALETLWGMARQGAICTLPALFFPSHLYFLTVFSSPDHVNPPPSHLWLLP